MKLFTELNEILFPGRCIGCSSLGSSLCQVCARSWSPSIYRQKLSKRYQSTTYSTRDLTIYSSSLYSPVAKRVLLAAKESHIRDADKLLIAALDISIDYFLRDFNRLTISALIPVPSRPKAIRERGRDFLTEISQIVARNRQIPVSSLLGYSRAVKDQSRLSIEERWSNLEGAFLLQSNRAGDLAVRSSKGSAVLLVDDLVTTGATLLEAERALNYAGIRVAGAVTACVAQPLR